MNKYIIVLFFSIFISGCAEIGFIAMSKGFDAIVFVDSERNGGCPGYNSKTGKWDDIDVEDMRPDGKPKNKNCFEWRRER